MEFSAQKSFVIGATLILVVGGIMYYLGLERAIDMVLIGFLVWWYVGGKKKAREFILLVGGNRSADPALQESRVSRRMSEKRVLLLLAVVAVVVVVTDYLHLVTWIRYAGCLVAAAATIAILEFLDKRHHR